MVRRKPRPVNLGATAYRKIGALIPKILMPAVRKRPDSPLSPTLCPRYPCRMQPPVTGRCHCGAIAYRSDGPPLWQMHCHCESCRRTTGAAFASFLGLRDGTWRWTKGSPAVFRSSADSERLFCPDCGTPLAYRSARFPDETHIHAGTLDYPETFRPTAHVHVAERLAWADIHDHSPRHAGPDDPAHPHQATDPYDWPALLSLIHRAFAYMEGVIDPPSSLHRLTPESVAALSRDGEIWAIGTPPVACVFLTPEPDALYLGKLAVDPSQQGRGHARTLIDLAAMRARALGLPALELRTRVELVANHAIFARMGFTRTAATAHSGYDRPTSLTFRRPV